MANEWQMALLKFSIPVWNKWRERYPNAHVDLSGTDLRKIEFKTYVRTWNELSLAWELIPVGPNLNRVDFRESDLSGVNLYDVNFDHADLSDAKLHKTELSRCNLSGANLGGADLTDASLHNSNLEGAILDNARLRRANFSFANLFEASLCGADLLESNFSLATSVNSNFSGAKACFTVFGNFALGTSIGLEAMVHRDSSFVTSYALSNSMGKIPEVFLRGCGLSDWEIENAQLYQPNLSNDEIAEIQYRVYELRATQALQVSPLFISYNRIDDTFVDKLEGRLNARGIRFWRDIHDMKSGRIEKQIDRAIHQNPTVLLVLSEHSLASDWVEHEVRTARGLEKELARDVLCPVALDDSWKDSRWPRRVMEQIMEYNILDFSAWEDDVKFDSMFRKFIDGLELFYKG